MALLDNIGSLVGMLIQPGQHQESRQLADRAGVSTNDFSRIAAIGLPLLLQGMNRNNQDPEGLASFNQALSQHQSKNNYDNLAQFTQNVDTDDGNKILNHVLGGNKDTVGNGLAQRLGIDSNTVIRTLSVLAPIVLKFLADRKQENDMGPEDVQKETENATQEVAQQVKNYDKTGDLEGGLLGNLLGGLTASDDSAANDDGLLGDIFNIFK